MESGSNFDSSRAELFEALGHPTRVRILRSLEDGPTGFAQLKRGVGIESSGQLQFHLGKLSGLVTTNSEGSYTLTDEGREAIRVLKTVPIDFTAPSVRHSAAGRNDWTKSLRVFQVVSVVLLVLIAVFGFAYYSQATQVSSLSTQVQSLNSGVQTLQSRVSSVSSQAANWQSIAEGGKSAVLVDKLSVSSNCSSPNLGYVGQIVAFQANYSGYLAVMASDFTNNSKAIPFLQLSGHPSFPAGNTVMPGTYGVYPIPLPATSTPISFTTLVPVSPSPGSFTLSLVPAPPGGYCVTGANASGTFSVTYYY
jgi:DNA-binding transcriptional ArsR family regulator/outer membrane murein-binding lipoprotein Lpp